MHGACNPIKAIDGREVDAVVVGGIGAGALSKLNAMGKRVYGSAAATVGENLDLLKSGNLRKLMAMHACAGHEGGCNHSEQLSEWRSACDRDPRVGAACCRDPDRGGLPLPHLHPLARTQAAPLDAGTCLGQSL